MNSTLLHGTLRLPDINTVRDLDRDSISILPLSSIPLETKGLQDLRLIKNNHLEGVVEMFEGTRSGRGLLLPENLQHEFSTISGHDSAIISKLAELHSYDVYSLRISLREMNVKVNDAEHLKLSKKKQEELSVYLQPFIKRLISQIYGEQETLDVSTDLTALFNDPDAKVVRQKLGVISEKLGIELHEVPLFFEEYGDIYLSIAYFRQCLESIDPIIENFLRCTKEIMEHEQFKQNVELNRVSKRLHNKTKKIREVLAERFAIFSQSTEAMWQNMSAEQFSDFKRLVEENHSALGGLLCTLTVKMQDWDRKFPMNSTAGPGRWSDHIMMDMRQGF